MSDEATQNQTATEPTAQTDPVTTEEVKNPEAVLAKNRELLESLAKTKSQLAEIEAEKKATEEQKLKEDGKLRELLEAKEKELSEISEKAGRVDSYEKYFTDRLEEKMEGLNEAQKTLLMNSTVSLSDKVKLADELQGAVTPSKTSSPGSARPSSGNPAKFDLKDYEGKDGQAKLTSLYYNNRELYDEVIRARKLNK